MNQWKTAANTSAHSFNHKKYQPFPVINKPNRRWPSQTIQKAPLWCAVDLRDGNQALIDPMSVQQKQKMWALMVKLGLKEVEVGFPAASQEDFDFCRWLIESDQIPEDVTIQVLVQARDKLIERTFEALDGIKQAIIHVYNSTSPVQRNKVFRQEKDGIIDIAKKGAAKIKAEAEKRPETNWRFEYSPESFSNTEIDFAIEICNTVIEVWEPTPDNKVIINLPSTVESSTPNVFADQVETFCDLIKQRESILISLHTHNDRGCAIAAAELGLLAGADRIEGTLMGNGERTGNMDIVTLAMNLYSQGIDPQLDLSNVNDIVNTVSECTKIPTHPRHPWVGELVYTAFSGSHQDAIRKCLAVQEPDQPWDVAYLPIDPADLGRDYQSVIRVNSQSGKGGVAYILENDHGLQLPRWFQIEASRKIQLFAESAKAEVSSSQIWQIIQQSFINESDGFQLTKYQIDRENNYEIIQADLFNASTEIRLRGTGEGALAAFCNGLHVSLGLNVEIVQYDQHAISSGSDATAAAYVQTKINGQNYYGISKSVDTLTANFDAVLSCVNQSLSQKVSKIA